MSLHIADPYDTARRVAIAHTIGGEIDRRTLAVDPAFLAQTAAERVRELTVSLGVVAAAEHAGQLDEALLEHAALTVAWLETQARERAA